MLVLSRKAGERIHIGDNIFIEVRRIAGCRVALAIEAPRDVRILRGELKEAAHAFDVKSPPVNRSTPPDACVVSHHRIASPGTISHSQAVG